MRFASVGEFVSFACPSGAESFVAWMETSATTHKRPATMESKTSPYLLIFRETSPDAYKGLSPEQRQQLMQQWNEWYDGLAADGKVQHGQPLEPQGRVVTERRVVDGPFAEAKEAVGGYFMLTVADLDEATAIAQKCPSLRYGMSVEVRPVAAACAELGVHGRPPAVREVVRA